MPALNMSSFSFISYFYFPLLGLVTNLGRKFLIFHLRSSPLMQFGCLIHLIKLSGRLCREKWNKNRKSKCSSERYHYLEKNYELWLWNVAKFSFWLKIKGQVWFQAIKKSPTLYSLLWPDYNGHVPTRISEQIKVFDSRFSPVCIECLKFNEVLFWSFAKHCAQKRY